MFGDDLVAYLPEHIRPLAQQLKQFPRAFEKWVYASSAPSKMCQGDIVTRLSFVAIGEDGDAVLLENSVGGIVVSVTCDAQPGQGEFVLVAPVFDLDDYRNNSTLKGEELENHIRALTENKISNLLFLPNGSGIRRCFADFGSICPVSLSYFHSNRGQERLASLSQYGHYFLLMKLAYHFTRAEPSELNRPEPSTFG